MSEKRILVHYDHTNKKILIDYINEGEQDSYLMPVKDEEGDIQDPDPYWHTLPQDWEVVVRSANIGLSDQA